jgi:hypothetical protein
LEADGIQLLRRVEGGEQTGAVTETEKKEIDDLSRRAFFFCSLETPVVIPSAVKNPASFLLRTLSYLSEKKGKKKKKIQSRE